MNLHKVIVRPGIRTSAAFGRLNFFQRDLFYGLLSAAHTKGGWFEADAALLRAALFAPCLGKVSERDVRDGLLKLREVGIVKLWTGRNGRAYGAVEKYQQRFAYGEVLPPEAHPPGDELPLDLFADEEPPEPDEIETPPPAAPDPKPKQKRRESEENARGAAPSTPTKVELQEDWIGRIARAWPGVNILAELDKAKRKWGTVDRARFEKHWLTNCGETVSFATVRTAAATEPEPEGWRAYLKDEYEGESWAESAALYAWGEMPANWRAKIARETASV